MKRPPEPVTETPGPRCPIVTFAEFDAVIRKENSIERTRLSRLSRMGRLRSRAY